VLRPTRHHLLYARQNWKEFRLILAVFALGYVGLGVYEGITRHSFAAGAAAGLAAVLPLVLMVAVYLYSRQTYVDVDQDVLRVHFPLRRASIPYTEVEKVRIDTLRNLFERPQFKKKATGTVKKLYSQRAVCLRIRDEEGLERLRRKLGPRTVMEKELVLAVNDAEDAYGQVKQRLAARRQRPDSAGPEETSGRHGRRGRRRRR
jgi:hypothetical protein